MAIVFLLSGSYCHGDELAASVAADLGCARLEQELLDRASQRFGLSRENIDRSLRGDSSLRGRFTREREKTVASLRLCLADLLPQDNLLLHGCAGKLVPRTISHILQVCAIANLDYRVKSAIQSEKVGEKDALRLVRTADDHNIKCVGNMIGKSPYDDSLYDIVVPMHELSVAEATALIGEQARSEAVKTTDRSRPSKARATCG